MKFYILFLLLISIFYNDASGQNTPEELGDVVFNVFKTKDTLTLDTLTPKATEVIEFYTRIDTTIEFLKDTDFARKYTYHDSMFKRKCKRIMYDTSFFKINWDSISLVKIEHVEKVLEERELSSLSKSFSIHFLEIVFSYSNARYSLFFKGLNQYNGIWKLGESMRIRKIEE